MTPPTVLLTHSEPPPHLHANRPVPPPRSDGGTLPAAIWRVLRPEQWLKNLLLLAAPFAAEALVDVGHVARLAVGIVAFSLAASSGYILNDCVDAERDRLHPNKRHRPVASGALPKPVALGLAVLIGVASLATAAWLGWSFAAVIALYVLVTSAYSSVLKHIPIVDVVAVATGFLLRGIAGAAALRLPVSAPFLLVISFAALFLVVGKRLGDVTVLGSNGGQHRSTLNAYTPPFVAQLLAVSSTGTLVTYAMWAFSLQTGEAGIPWLSLSVLPFAIGVLRAVQLILLGEGADPADLLTDLGLCAAAGATGALLAAGLIW